MTTITPFRVAVPQADLDDLQARLALTRFTDEIPGADQGVTVERVGAWSPAGATGSTGARWRTG
ncbi:hypothetical protein Nocox_05605 [Nonomuraea coxensis DSM 45129]|uniref:Epoxide hydrolase N-terminal domain-containing protein n=1 Tax=Nonomuraea coxensis DSM 45129 TaxID=1122611 RepID=A0ABX8TTQ4_9ACTN|nr:epoxide hydrolase N-terminal domain-containing protein [Nonomuraea coxensis]QYC38748.1 hypothetical protein Nocox_05605 [Nonomuraea coxensis DSM 45129]